MCMWQVSKMFYFYAHKNEINQFEDERSEAESI